VARDASGAAVTGRELSWTSSNPSIATVSATGLVTGVAEGGPVTISAIVEGKSASARIMVTPAPVATLTISPDPLAVQVGSTAALMLVARDAAGNQLGGRLVTLTTSNAAVATVDANRMVTGVSAGTATITATSEGKTATATVIVAPGPVASVEIAPTAPSVRVGATIPMTATLRDASGAVVTGRIVTWTSSDPGKATVSGTGVVTGVAVGTATITATSEGKSASTTVTILRMPVSSVEVLGVGTLIVGDTVRVQAIVRDSLGRTLTDRVVTFRGSNDAVATVSSSGLVSAFSAGNVTVTATSEGVSGTTEIAVADVRVSFTGGTCLTVRVGATCTSSANLRYVGSNNIVPNRRPATIVSSNSSIAQTGAPEYPESSPSRVQVSVTGVAPGTVTLTARYVGANGTIRTDTMEFTVQP
jgi:uncharacterized protein YjdB